MERAYLKAFVQSRTARLDAAPPANSADITNSLEGWVRFKRHVAWGSRVFQVDYDAQVALGFSGVSPVCHRSSNIRREHFTSLYFFLSDRLGPRAWFETHSTLFPQGIRSVSQHQAHNLRTANRRQHVGGVHSSAVIVMSSSTQYILTRDDDQFSTRAANSIAAGSAAADIRGLAYCAQDLHERREWSTLYSGQQACTPRRGARRPSFVPLAARILSAAWPRMSASAFMTASSRVIMGISSGASSLHSPTPPADTPMTYRQSRSNSIDSLNLTPDIVCVYYAYGISGNDPVMYIAGLLEAEDVVEAHTYGTSPGPRSSRGRVPPDGVMLALEEKRPCNAYSLESYLTDFNLDIAYIRLPRKGEGQDQVVYVTRLR
ncbi:hypothetical protein C8J57DRAFT_1247914 [Mycena rebaudengoi]|nr:hypothetical protein C8J57DRAFT_1247914 [Mycena rebaudengoi]